MEENRGLLERLCAVQRALKVPKSKRNEFGGYRYRTAEGIMEAAKPLLMAEGLTLVVSDGVELIGDRYYVVATATVTRGTESVSTRGYAREEESKKGMDASQITGAASSYARKYALGGLFAIDDTKDADALNTTAAYTQKAEAAVPDEMKEVAARMKADVALATTAEAVRGIWEADEKALRPYKALHSDVKKAVIERGMVLKSGEATA